MSMKRAARAKKKRGRCVIDADCEGGRSAFWDNEAARMRWVLKIIQTHPLGKVKAGE